MNIQLNNRSIKIDKVCDNIVSQAHGLMFSKKKTALFIFKTPRSITIHTWFMFYPIDLFFLDEQKNIIEVKKNMKPFSIYQSKNKAHFLVEVPSE